MSNGAAWQPPSAPRQPTWSFKIQNFSTPQTFAAKSVAEPKAHATKASVPNQVATSSSSTLDARNSTPTERSKARATRKRRRLDKEEEGIKSEIAASVAANLEYDQIMSLYPDAETPFENEMDVVQRLLPYHIFQYPRHDLDELRGIKGKERAKMNDILKDEVKETKFAIECHRRFRSLELRMKRARMEPGKSTIPLDQAIALERLLLESEHGDSSNLEQELSTARSELDKIFRVQRLAKSAAAKTTPTTSNSVATNNTNSSIQSPSTPYYSYSNPTFNASSNPNFANYYSSYTYPYTQALFPGVPYTPSTKYGSTTVPSASSQLNTTAVVSQPQTSANPPSTPSSSTTVPMRPPPVAIPLQLPVTSLPALQSLGIMPVPKASLPPSTSPQPAAVLLGSSNNGTMLSLEINAALLHPPQMSGLAILLSSLVKMSGGPNGTGQTPGASTGDSAQGITNGDGDSKSDIMSSTEDASK